MYRCVCKGRVYEFEKIKQCLKGKKDVSVVLPTYNEEGNIGRLIKALKQHLKRYDYEVIVVDDNSKDKTPKIIDDLAKKGRVVALHRYRIKGIFSAIQDGIKISRGKIIVIMDADFSHPPHIVPKLLAHIEDYDMVSGSRFIKGSGIEAPFIRKIPTIALNIVVRLILGLKPHDLTGGFHAIKKDKFNELRFRYKTVFGEFDMELFYLANRKRWRIKEVPFTYNYREEGASKFSDSLTHYMVYGMHYLKRVIQIRLFR